MKINYEKDFVAWADEQSILLEQERFAELDLIHLIEEVRDLGSNDKHALKSNLRISGISMLFLRVKVSTAPGTNWSTLTISL
ncbi:DUF29 family protein [Chroococcidiopsis sp. CCMEE 29]|uniref:DUF29 family protein n=1 Tax=Chroococcidiopsis sp. CCMEE 29 TaxID=155894 RepID=UPI0020204B97|nr:DUF29 family protein [Chroococcidiopsis sp. CCMEE 29]